MLTVISYQQDFNQNFISKSLRKSQNKTICYIFKQMIFER